MVKFINNFIVLIFSLIILDCLMYFNDYNEILSLRNYIIYDIENNGLESFKNSKYQVDINYTDSNEINYKIIYERESIFNVKKFKKIEFNGIVN